MFLLNFAHPLTPAHLAALESLTGQPIERVIDLPSQVDTGLPLAPQITAMVGATGLTPTEWQTAPLLVNPPSLNYSAVTLLGELHGRMGYFPAVLRLRPVAGSTPARYEVADVLNLQAVREVARMRRR